MAGVQATADERLLRALAEELKLPLLQIARASELAQQQGDTQVLSSITRIAETALRLVDGFLLSTDLITREMSRLEPVPVASVLYDTARKLEPLARQNNCDIELSLHGRYGPAMAHRESLETALMLLGYSMIEARTPERQRHRILLAAHKSTHGLVVGVFDNQPGLSADMFRRGRALYGSARQALPTVSASSGAGVFVADALLKAMEAPLRIARHDKLAGLATTLYLSQQVQLV
ncbi:MAG TPA: hypothetical protein VK674_01420 [Candidatus Limnocylindria bacterium]|nr:hypothetical protein [Candidatus Limnocylindria bacterium]